ncbi:hypothetical protein JCM10908_001830 [Rhodotorula pacifica]|uniref:gamma-tubulin-complex subunit SPC97 n=1 Tax=Rhodotorula pacifica TaxID=1495444 RepID=UPI00317242F6
MSERIRTDSRSSQRPPPARPGSSLSATSSTATRTGTTSRPTSSLAHIPQPPNHPKTPKPSAARYGGLAEKELQKLQSSIRAATKTGGAGGLNARLKQHRPSLVREVDERDEHAAAAPENSFIADSSFTRAPLNSRVPPISPHRLAGKRTEKPRSSSAPTASGSSRPSRAVRSNERYTADAAEEEDDEVPDSGSVIEEEEVDEETRLKRDRLRRKELGLEKEPLEGLNAELQEALISEDLLFVLTGIEGRYIEYDPSYTPQDDFERLQGAQFIIDPQLDPRIASLVARFLPLATYYTAITAFIEEYSLLEHGTVNHALCAAIRDMLTDYLVLIARLEEQFNYSASFTLQRFWLLVHPALNTLSLVYDLINEIVELSIPSPEDDDEDGSNAEDEDSDDGYGAGLGDVLAELKAASAAAKPASETKTASWRLGPSLGGETLFLLSNLLTRTAGNPAAHELYSHLLLRASQPYARILIGWISTGRLEDRWDEFCVREQGGFSTGTLDADYTDEYWERRYTLRNRPSSASSAAVASSSAAAAMGKAPVKSFSLDDRPRERGLAGGAVIPPFLEQWEDMILLAGKYLNVIRECGIEVEVPEAVGTVGEREDGMIDMQDDSFYKRIEAAYTYANKTLLKLLLEEEHLLSRLETIKQCFFINHGDVFTHFLDMAKQELNRKKKRIVQERLQTQLDLALLRSTPSSSGSGQGQNGSDGFKDDLRIVFEDVTVADWLLKVVNQTGAMVGPDGLPVDMHDSGKRSGTGDKPAKDAPEPIGWDVFNLDYSVKFPLSLVLSRKSITYYQMIFRHLLRLRQLERIFQDTWTEHLKTPSWRNRSPYPELQSWKGRVFALRARMYDFIQQMFDFAVSEVLEVRWGELRKKLERCETVDQLLKDHDNFLNTCTNECLLTNEKLLELFHQKLFNTCYVFANYTTSFTRIVVQTEAQANGDWARLGGKFKEHWDFLSRFEKHFDHFIAMALNHLELHAARENSRILPLMVRLSSLKGKSST